MMRLLLDTHALIWWLTDNRRLSRTARGAIADPDNLVMASAASGYEIANKQRLGRLSGKIAQDLPKALREARIPVHALTLAHTIAAGLLPGPHRDPWDRLIMAQALSDDLTVVTVDPVFEHYALPSAGEKGTEGDIAQPAMRSQIACAAAMATSSRTSTASAWSPAASAPAPGAGASRIR